MHSEAHLLEGRAGDPWRAGRGPLRGELRAAAQKGQLHGRWKQRLPGGVPAASHPAPDRKRSRPSKPGRASRGPGNGPQGPAGWRSSGADSVAVMRRQGPPFWIGGRPLRAAGRARRGGRSLRVSAAPLSSRTLGACGAGTFGRRFWNMSCTGTS